MASDPTSSGNRELEQALRDLHPAALDEGFLARLDAAVEDSLATLTPAERRLEGSLASHRPTALSASFMDRLEAIVEGVPFAVDEKIVLFPKTAPAKKAEGRKFHGWAAAAAVALIGGVSALMIPGGKPSENGVATRNDTSSPAPFRADRSNFAPAGFNSTADTEDVGVSWHQAGQPHRVLRLTYRDRVTLKNAKGETIEVEQPRTEYILVPEKVD